MLGIDPNVLVRFLVRDEERQFARAQRLLRREAERGEPVFISHLVLLETEWVLRSRYGLSKSEILGAFHGLLESADLQIEAEPSVEQALYIWKDSAAEFADCLISMRHLELGCHATVSFDQRALKLPGFVAA